MMAVAQEPREGDQVFISPAAGIHGHGCWWAIVVGVMPALVNGAVYLRVVPVEDLMATPQVFYARTGGLLVNRDGK